MISIIKKNTTNQGITGKWLFNDVIKIGLKFSSAAHNRLIHPYEYFFLVHFRPI
jgi:hypothetical protein